MFDDGGKVLVEGAVCNASGVAHVVLCYSGIESTFCDPVDGV